MAYSTQRDFITINYVNESPRLIDHKNQLIRKKSDTILKTYESCTDGREWTMDSEKRARLLTDIIHHASKTNLHDGSGDSSRLNVLLSVDELKKMSKKDLINYILKLHNNIRDKQEELLKIEKILNETIDKFQNIQKIVDENASLQDLLRLSEEKISTLCEENNNLKIELQNSLISITTSNDLNVNDNERVQQLVNYENCNCNDNTEFQNTISKLQNEIDQLIDYKKKYKILSKKYDKLTGQLEEKTNSEKIQENLHSKLFDDITDERNRLQEQLRQMHNIEEKLKDLKSRADYSDTLEKERNELLEELNKYRRKQDVTDVGIDNNSLLMMKTMSEVQMNLTELKLENDKLMKEIDTYKLQAANWNQQMKILHLKLHQVYELEQDLNATKAQLSIAENAIDEYEKHIELQVELINDRNYALSVAEQRLSTMQNIRQDIQELKNELYQTLEETAIENTNNLMHQQMVDSHLEDVVTGAKQSLSFINDKLNDRKELEDEIIRLNKKIFDMEKVYGKYSDSGDEKKEAIGSEGKQKSDAHTIDSGDEKKGATDSEGKEKTDAHKIDSGDGKKEAMDSEGKEQIYAHEVDSADEKKGAIDSEGKEKMDAKDDEKKKPTDSEGKEKLDGHEIDSGDEKKESIDSEGKEKIDAKGDEKQKAIDSEGKEEIDAHKIDSGDDKKETIGSDGKQKIHADAVDSENLKNIDKTEQNITLDSTEDFKDAEMILQKSIENLQSEIHESQTNLFDRLKEVDELNLKNEKLTKELDDALGKCEAREQEQLKLIEELKQTNSELNDQINQLQSEISELNKLADDISKERLQNDQLQNQLETSESAKRKIGTTSSLNSITKTFSQLEVKLVDEQAKNNDLKLENDQLHDELKDLKNQLNEFKKNMEINDVVKEQFDDFSRKIDEQQTEINNYRQREIQCLKQCDEFKQKIKELQNQIATLQRQNNALSLKASSATANAIKEMDNKSKYEKDSKNAEKLLTDGKQKGSAGRTPSSNKMTGNAKSPGDRKKPTDGKACAICLKEEYCTNLEDMKKLDRLCQKIIDEGLKSLTTAELKFIHNQVYEAKLRKHFDTSSDNLSDIRNSAKKEQSVSDIDKKINFLDSEIRREKRKLNDLMNALNKEKQDQKLIVENKLQLKKNIRGIIAMREKLNKITKNGNSIKDDTYST